MRATFPILLSTALACGAEQGDHIDEVPYEVSDTAPDEPDDSRDSTEVSGDSADSLAAGDAIEGSPDSTDRICREGRIPLSVAMTQGSEIIDQRTWEVTLEGTLTAHANSELELTTSQEVYRFTYAIGGEALPVTVGDELTVTWRTNGTPSFGQMTRMVSSGIAIRDYEGSLIAVIDDGKYGGAWPSTHVAFEDFSVTTEDIGCSVRTDSCGYRPMGMRFTYDGGDLLLPPVTEGTLNLGGNGYRVVNAYTRAPPIPPTCTDPVANSSWLIVRLE